MPAIGMVHQHFALAESLTVLENVVLGTRPLGSLRLDLGGARAKLDRADGRQRPRRAARPARLAPFRRREAAARILKVLYRGARILVLDEPTAVLTPQEVEGLFACCAASSPAGLSIIFISHKMNEVLAIADRIAVLRAGRKVADRPAAGADRATLAELMVGREVRKAAARRARRDPRCSCSTRDVGDPHGRAGLVEASLSVHAGEIVGIAGVSGNGQGALAGAHRRHDGRGRRRSRSTASRCRRRRAPSSRPASAAFRKTATTRDRRRAVDRGEPRA